MDACTTVARRDLPAARVLAASFLRRHSGSTFTVLLTDDVAGECVGDDEPFELVHPQGIGLARAELAHLALALDEAGLAAALTPALLHRLLVQGAPSVLYLAPDVAVYGPLDGVGRLAERHSVVVVPRLTAPLPEHEDEVDTVLRAASVLDDGLIAVGPEAGGFLDWLRERLCRPGETGAWLDLTPGMFGAHILRDPGCQVASWNLDGRVLRRVDDGYEVDDDPLRSFRFGSSDAGERDGVGRLPARPVPLTSSSDLDSLRREHADRLRVAGRQGSMPRYAFGFLPDGSPVDERMRRLYREAVDEGPESPPPNPFAEDPEAFVGWLNEATFPALRPTVPRYLARLWLDTDDLRQRFPSLIGETAEHYLAWIYGGGGDERAVPACVRRAPELVFQLRAQRRLARPRSAPERGVNLVGYLQAVFGVGEVARILVAALTRAGVPVAVVDDPVTLSERSVQFDSVPAASAGYDVNLLCVNAAQVPALAEQLGPEFFARRHTVGLWFWEVENFPVPAHAAIDLLDEVWVASEHTRHAISAVTEKLVRTIPVPVIPPSAPAVTRAELGLRDDTFVFYYTFDYLSVPPRKNPIGLIQAFTRAFRPGEGAALVLKSINGHQRVEDRERVRVAAGDRADIVVIDEYLPAERHAGLLGACDAYVSLHRSEGFGLALAEAIASGKPVIATGYSGNLDYMEPDTSYLVDFDLTSIGPGCDPYPSDGRWAEPDLDHAATLMREVFEYPDEARARARRAAESLLRERSVDAAGRALADMVEDLRRDRLPPATWRSFFMRGWRVEPREFGIRRYEYDWLPNGTPVDALMHRLLSGRGEYSTNPPDPEDAPASLAWLNESVVPERWPVVSRYLYEFWEGRDDMQQHFPLPDLMRDPGAYLSWLHHHAHAETDIPYELIPTRATVDRATQIPPEPRPVPPRLRGLAYRALRLAYRAFRRVLSRRQRAR